MACLCQRLSKMTKYKIEHHQIIESALSNFNADFFCKNNILFGGGTRIALELDEFRESVDIDFLCPDRKSYRAVREQVTNVTLGDLVKEDFDYAREIRADRDGVRTVIRYKNTLIKLEFVSFDSYELSHEWNPENCPVPVIDQVSCFYTKLLANSDRKLIAPYKDIFDILAMYQAWGSIPEAAIGLAENHYGKRVVIPDLLIALDDIKQDPDKYLRAAKAVKMKIEWAESLVKEQAPKLIAELNKSEPED